MINLDHKFQSIVENNCQLALEEPVLVGVSGGPDSICLLHRLHQHGYDVVVAHFNHEIRPEAAADEAFVRDFADRLKVAYVAGRADVEALAAKTGASLEAAGRDARYRFLFDQAVRLNAQAVAVGHTADDQVETILMHFLRGAGLRGLRGMLYRRRLPQYHPDLSLVRPLLSYWREDILAYCEGHDLVIREDPTNQDSTFLRNRVRQELLPYLESYNPRLKEGVLRMAGILAGDFEIVQHVLDRYWAEVLIEAGETGYGLRRSLWEQLPTAIQQGLMLRALRDVSLDGIEIDFETTHRALVFLSSSEHNGRLFLRGGIQVVRRPDQIWVLREGAPVPGELWPAVAKDSLSILEVPGELRLPGRWRLAVRIVDDFTRGEYAAGSALDGFQAWVDADRCPGPFSIRARRPGDRFRPLGLEGHSQKLSDVMIDEKIPVEVRDTWPLVEYQEEILWLPGYRSSHQGRVRSNTRRVLHFNLIHSPD